MKKFTVCLIVIISSLPVFAQRTATPAVRAEISVASQPRVAEPTTRLNNRLTTVAVAGFNLNGLVMSEADVAKVAADMTSLDTAVANAPMSATRLAGLPEAAVGSLKAVAAFRASSEPGSDVIAGAALNVVKTMEASLDPSTNVAVQTELFSLIARAGFDGVVTANENRAIVALAARNGIRLDDVKECN